MNDNTEKYRNIILPIITKHLPNAKVILYGSRARKDAREGSDIDVALDMGKKIDHTVFNKILSDLEGSRLPINYDIVDLYTVSEHMQKEILKDGIIWKE